MLVLCFQRRDARSVSLMVGLSRKLQREVCLVYLFHQLPYCGERVLAQELTKLMKVLITKALTSL